MPEPGIQTIIDSGSTVGADVGTAAPTTALSGLYVRAIDNRTAVVTVRSSTDYTTSVTSTQTSDQNPYGGVVGMHLCVDQSNVAASSAGGGTGTLTHTIQFKDPIGGTYVNSTGVITGTTAITTWILQCYPGMGTVTATSSAVGKADLSIATTWRINTASSSSATNFTYSIAAVYLPTAASSS